MIVVSLLIVIAGTDLKGKVVFDVHTLSLVGVCLIYSVYATANILYLAHVRPEYITLNKDTIIFLPVVSSILGCLAGIVIMEILARFGSIVKKGTRMFEVGDTYIAAGLGALFGWQMIVPVILLSIVVQVVLFLPIFIRDLFLRKETKTLVALLSFIAYAIIFFALEQTGIITVDKLIVYIPAVLVLALLGIYSCVRIITNLKENPSSGTCMPFGPAMVAAAFLTFILTAFI